jgi:hypothetical protein
MGLYVIPHLPPSLYQLANPKRPQVVFTGKELLASINNQKQRHLQLQMDLKSNIPFDHVGIFREKTQV